MKIIHAVTSLDKGGAENHVVSLATEQRKKKNDITIFVSKNSSYWLKFLKKAKIQVKKTQFFKEDNLVYKIYKFFKDFYFLTKLIDNKKPDILHAHLPYMELVSFFSLYFSSHKPKFIITKHVDSDFFYGSITQKKTYLGSFFTKIISLKSTKIIAISKAVKKYFILGKFGIEEKKIKHIYYGLDNLKISTKKDFRLKKYNIKRDELILGCIARLVPQKSIENLIISLRYLNKFKFKLVIVGNGPLKRKLKTLSKKLEVSDQIIWIDFLDDVKKFYTFIDIFVLTSLYEGLGLVFLEAMICKKPIITSNISAMKEVIKNNHNGILVKPNNPVLLSKAIFKLRNKNFRNKLGLAGFKYVKKNFSVKEMYEKTQKIYLIK